MSRLLVFALTFVSCVAAQSGLAQNSFPGVRAHFNLTVKTDGFAGSLDLLEDPRITPELDQSLWQSGGPEMALDEHDPLLQQLATSPLRSAVLRLRDSKGHTVAETTLQREQARIEFSQLHPGRRSIFVTTDLSAGLGSYSGPFTQILDVSRGNLDFVQARNVTNGIRGSISLASTLKTAWRTISASAGSRDILQVACRPKSFDPNSAEFVITYTRYHWNGSEWLMAQAESPGMWESEERFPLLKRFPPAVETGSK